MAQAKTITSFFMQGSMRGPRYVQFSFHTARLFVLPRINMDVVNDYDELDTPCFYILTGEDGGNPIAYIGQAASFKHRVIDHKQKKEFWDTAYVLVASDKESLQTTDVQYLEFRAIQDALAVSAYDMKENKQKPKKPTLSKHREADLEQIYDELKLLVEFVGCDIFVKNEGKPDDPAEFIASALAPASVIRVDELEEEKACRVIVPNDQLSLAIGKEGQNARLAVRLTGYKIDIKPLSQIEF